MKWMDNTALEREAAINSGQNPDETVLMRFGQSAFGMRKLSALDWWWADSAT